MAIDIMACYSTQPKPRDYVLPGLIPGTVGAIVSPGGAGKSMMSLMIAHYVAAGIDLLGFGKLNTGPVTYLSAEDGEDVLHERLYALGGLLNASQREACAKLLTIEDMTQYTPDLTRADWLKFLEDNARLSRLLFIDTLRSFHSADENDGNAMAVLIGNIRAIAARTKCAIVFLHHSSKALAISGQGDMQQASRGSSVLTDNIRWQAFLAAMAKEEATKLTDYEFCKSNSITDDERKFFVRFGISKQNYGSPLSDKWFKREQGGVLRPVQLRSATRSKEGGKRDEL